MIPAFFVRMETLPLNASGKVDRKSLPAPEIASIGPDSDLVQPRSEMERTLHDTWKEILGKERIGIYDNYFVLGGDSIKAIQIASRLAQEGMKLEIRELLLHPTIAELSEKVVVTERVADQGAVTGSIPLTAVQSWFFENHGRYPGHFNQSVMLYSKERLDDDALRAVFEAIQKHHDALRMRYESEGDKIIQENCGSDYPPRV